jgi:hypothetical protein
MIFLKKAGEFKLTHPCVQHQRVQSLSGHFLWIKNEIHHGQFPDLPQ